MKNITEFILVLLIILSTNSFANEFSFLGPLSQKKINTIKIVDDYNKGIFSNNLWNSNWQLNDGIVISWRKCNFNRQFLSIEINKKYRLKPGSFLIFKTLLLNPEKQIVRYISNKQNLK